MWLMEPHAIADGPGGHDYTAHGSYDTHAAQLAGHAALLEELSGALKAFLDDLAAAKLADRILVLCFSEFGRRVQENGSGTDHGPAKDATSEERAAAIKKWRAWWEKQDKR